MRLRSAIFQRSHAALRRLPPWTFAIHSFAWLQVLSPRDLQDITTSLYSDKERATYGSDDHNFQELWPWEDDAFRQIFDNSQEVLVAAAGGGREMIALSKMGHTVAGFDPSEELVAACKLNLAKAGINAPIELSPPNTVPGSLATFSALVIGRGSYHHIPGREQRINFLIECQKRLKAGSPVFLGDFYTRTEAGHRLTAIPTGRVERGDSIGVCFFHYFTWAEIENELRLAGLIDIEIRVSPTDSSETSPAHVLARSTKVE